MKIALILLAAGVAFLPPARGQTSWVTLRGQVTDSTQGAIVGATVYLQDVITRTSREIKTDNSGFYTLLFLEPGRYVIRVSALGFTPVERRDITASAGDVLGATFTLQVENTGGKINVTARPDAVETEGASRVFRIDSFQTQNLPVLGRQAYNLLSLSPGSLYAQEEFGSSGYTGMRNWEINGRYIVNGGLSGTNQFLLNEAPISLTGTWQLAPSVEAIQEVQVLANIYDAQFGRTGGGTIMTTLRSGSNEWHGSAYEYWHNGVFDANSFENNRSGTPLGEHISHQFGGVIGGPVRKDKDLVFLSLDGYWEVAPSPLLSSTPPLDLRDGQHFSKYRIQVYDPYTTHPCTPKDAPGGCLSPYIRSPFPGNIIPASRISPIGQRILALYPAPNDRGSTNNYNAGGSSGHYQYLQPIARWDHNFGDSDRLFTLFTAEHGSQNQSGNGFPGPADTGLGNAERTSQHYVMDWTRVINPSTIANLRASFGRFTQYFPESVRDAGLTADQLGINIQHPPTVSANAAPHVDLDLYSSIIGNSYSWRTENQLDVASSMTLTRGSHVLHFGGEWANAAVAETGPGRANGSLSFSHDWTQQYIGRQTGYSDGSSIADLLLGLPTSGYVDYFGGSYRRWPYFGVYVQDSWRLHPRLTLSLGLRYDVQIPYSELNNRTNVDFDFNAVNPYSAKILHRWSELKTAWDDKYPSMPYPTPPAEITGGFVPATNGNHRAFNTDWTDVQPRFGIAWSVTPKTVVRAGAGIFYRTETQVASSYGFNSRTYYLSSDDGGLTPAAGLTGPLSLQDPFPYGVLPPRGAAAGLGAGVGRPAYFFGRDRPIPRTYEYSAGLRRELPGLLLFEAAYSGSVTVHDALAATLNGALALQQNWTQAGLKYAFTPVWNPFRGVLPLATDLGFPQAVYAAALLRPYPQYNGLFQTNLPVARYRYDSLQVRLEKRVLDLAPTGVFSFLFAYTFSKSFEADHRLNPWNLSEAPSHELTPDDRTHNIAWAGTWDLPFGWGRRYFSNASPFFAHLINSWSADWIYTFMSGVPVNQPDAIFMCGDYMPAEGQTTAHWFNNDRKCYQTRAPWAYRITPDRFGNIRTPFSSQFNLSIEKMFWLNDRIALHFRGEAYNVSNSPVFGQPSTNLSDPRFGQLPLSQSNFPRFLQLAMRLTF